MKILTSNFEKTQKTCRRTRIFDVNFVLSEVIAEPSSSRGQGGAQERRPVVFGAVLEVVELRGVPEVRGSLVGSQVS